MDPALYGAMNRLATSRILGSLQSNHPPQPSPPQPQYGRAASPRDCHLPGAASRSRGFGGGSPIPNCSCEKRGVHFGALLTRSPAISCHSVAGVIQRRAEASAATETTMKRKQSSKNSPFINQLNCR